MEDIKGCLEFYDNKAQETIKQKTGIIGLTSKHIIQLQWIMVDYMNTLEATLMYWWQGTANSETLEKEFSFIINAPEIARPVNQLFSCYRN